MRSNPKPDREYLVSSYGSEQAFEDGNNSLAREGYELTAWQWSPETTTAPGRAITATYRRRRQVVLIVKET